MKKFRPYGRTLIGNYGQQIEVSSLDWLSFVEEHDRQRMLLRQEKRQTSNHKNESCLSLIAHLKGNTEENKTGTSEVIFKNSGLVVPRGLESKRVLKYFEFLYRNVGKCLHFPT